MTLAVSNLRVKFQLSQLLCFGLATARTQSVRLTEGGRFGVCRCSGYPCGGDISSSVQRELDETCLVWLMASITMTAGQAQYTIVCTYGGLSFGSKSGLNPKDWSIRWSRTHSLGTSSSPNRRDAY
jgi:hypothetical protein